MINISHHFLKATCPSSRLGPEALLTALRNRWQHPFSTEGETEPGNRVFPGSQSPLVAHGKFPAKPVFPEAVSSPTKLSCPSGSGAQKGLIKRRSCLFFPTVWETQGRHREARPLGLWSAHWTASLPACLHTPTLTPCSVWSCLCPLLSPLPPLGS